MEGPRLREYRDGEAEIGGGGVSKIEAKKNEIQLQGRMNTEIREIQVYIYISHCFLQINLTIGQLFTI